MTQERITFGLHRGGQAQVYRDTHRYRVVVAGRRWGKTHLARVQLLSWALAGGAGRYWYVAPTREDAKDIMWADLKSATHPDWCDGAPSETELSLRLINGAEVRLWSAEKGDALRGRALKGLVMDEYADMSPRVYNEILLPSLSDYGAPALWIGSPKSFNHFHAVYERGQSADWPEWASWQFRSIDNPTLNPEMVADARAQLDPRTFRQEWEASFEAVSGRAYYAFSRENVTPVELSAVDPVAVWFDFNVQPASVGIGQAQGDRICVWRTVQLSHRGGEATRATTDAARALLASVGHIGQVRLYGDATGRSAKTTGPSDHAVVRAGFPGASWRVPKANPHERDRVAAVNAACLSQDGARRLEVDLSCTELIADLEQVVTTDSGELDKRSDPMRTHISDALGYWIDREWPVRRRPDVFRAITAPARDEVSSAVAAIRARHSAAITAGLGFGRG